MGLYPAPKTNADTAMTRTEDTARSASDRRIAAVLAAQTIELRREAAAATHEAEHHGWQIEFTFREARRTGRDMVALDAAVPSGRYVAVSFWKRIALAA